MERATGKAQFIICNKERSAVRCESCLQIFCRNHLNDHCQELSQELVEIETDPDKHVLIKQIN